MKYLSHFDFDIHYIKGITNKVADALLCYYKSDTSEDVHSNHEYVNADIRIDKEHDDLPRGQQAELELDQLMALRCSTCLRDKQQLVREVIETQDREAAELQAHAENSEPAVPILEDEEDTSGNHLT